MAAVPLLLGQASFLYTFYPPEMAVTQFYLRAALLFIGSWFWCVDMVVAMMQWRKANPGMAVPTFITGFTVLATLEVSGRLRGGKGLFGWIAKLSWDNPMTLATMLSMLMLTVGGFGGVINASYQLNALIHNTQWITGHFHLIFGGTSVIMYFAVAYWAWPRWRGNPLNFWYAV